MKLLLTIFLTLVVFFPAHSEDKMKFGKIDPADLKMTHCPIDSSADAMVLGDSGSTYFTYEDQNGFIMNFERHIRIKIFTKKGYNEANIVIPFYHSTDESEKVLSLKARTYNLEGGKVVETKVEDESMFDEVEDAYWKNKRITFPAVKEGSIVELKFTIKSPFLANLRGWFFQGSLPIRYSEYEVKIPEYFYYSKQATGSVTFFINETSTSTNRITQSENVRGGNQYVVTHSISNSTIDYYENISKLATKNVPAFKEESYTNSIRNYVSKVEFEYNGYKFPNQALHSYNSTWEEVVKSLLEDDDFGVQIKKGGLVKEITDEIEGKAKTPFEKMLLAHEHMKTHMKWNGNSSKYPTTNLKKAMELKSGNCADINLSLVLLLRELGLSADPVIVSTRQHGLVLQTQPSLRKMNYVIAVVMIDDKYFLLDATSRYQPYNMLPFRCLNGEGLVVSKEQMRWLPIYQEEKDNTFYFGEFKVDAEGGVAGKLDVSESGYPGLSARNSYVSEGEEAYKKSKKDRLTAWTVENITLENMYKEAEAAKCVYQINSVEVAQTTDSLIYLNVLLNMGQETNPFLLENRNYPVDFGCPLKDAYVFNYEIPEGYKVVSLPEPMKVNLPEQAGMFKFTAAVTGNKIGISSQVAINKVFFTVAEYNNLREFFNKVTTKNAQQIVLKKI